MKERWRPVPGYEGHYAVSDRGRVKRTKFSQGVKRFGQPLRLQKTTAGYRFVGLYKNNVGCLLLVHRLVTAAFIGPCPDGWEVNHKNFDRADNRVENLEYLTPADNLRYTRENKDVQYVRGEDSPSAKLTEDDVRTMRKMYESPEWSYPKLAARFGIGKTTVENIIRRRKWRHVE